MTANGSHATLEPAGGQGGAVVLGADNGRGTLGHLRRLASHGFPIDADTRDLLIGQVKEAMGLLDPASRGYSRAVNRLARLLGYLEASNLRAIEVLDKIQRLDGGLPTEEHRFTINIVPPTAPPSLNGATH